MGRYQWSFVTSSWHMLDFCNLVSTMWPLLILVSCGISAFRKYPLNLFSLLTISIVEASCALYPQVSTLQFHDLLSHDWFLLCGICCWNGSTAPSVSYLVTCSTFDLWYLLLCGHTAPSVGQKVQCISCAGVKHCSSMTSCHMLTWSVVSTVVVAIRHLLVDQKVQCISCAGVKHCSSMTSCHDVLDFSSVVSLILLPIYSIVTSGPSLSLIVSQISPATLMTDNTM